jgi:hypothetical protein
MKLKKLYLVASVTLLAVTLAACGSSSDSANTNEKVTKIAFFGFWKTNSFTQAVLAGVKETAEAQGIEVVDLSPTEYDGAAQIKSMQDQIKKNQKALKAERAKKKIQKAQHQYSTPVTTSMSASIASASMISSSSKKSFSEQPFSTCTIAFTIFVWKSITVPLHSFRLLCLNCLAPLRG